MRNEAAAASHTFCALRTLAPARFSESKMMATSLDLICTMLPRGTAGGLASAEGGRSMPKGCDPEAELQRAGGLAFSGGGGAAAGGAAGISVRRGDRSRGCSGTQ